MQVYLIATSRALLIISVFSYLTNCTDPKKTKIETSELNLLAESEASAFLVSELRSRLREDFADKDQVCSHSGNSREACAVDVYERVYTLFESNPSWGTLTLGKLLAIIFTRELSIASSAAPNATSILVEAFMRNFWAVCYYKDQSDGCTPTDLVHYLASMQAWYGRGLSKNAEADLALAQSYQSSEGLIQSALQNTTWKQEKARLGEVPFKWANWACGNDGYDQLRNSNGQIGGKPLPLLIRWCSPNKEYDYYFSAVTLEQDRILPLPSAGGRNCPHVCTNSVEVIKTGYIHQSASPQTQNPNPAPTPPNTGTNPTTPDPENNEPDTQIPPNPAPLPPPPSNIVLPACSAFDVPIEGADAGWKKGDLPDKCTSIIGKGRCDNNPDYGEIAFICGERPGYGTEAWWRCVPRGECP
ncbi:MAG: hypothetical protein KBD78_10295 [Oligoflexales bacterium]|nr:hypothetical protein [Oligoflexales bacterium]